MANSEVGFDIIRYCHQIDKNTMELIGIEENYICQCWFSCLCNNQFSKKGRMYNQSTFTQLLLPSVIDFSLISSYIRTYYCSFKPCIFSERETCNTEVFYNLKVEIPTQSGKGHIVEVISSLCFDQLDLERLLGDTHERNYTFAI